MSQGFVDHCLELLAPLGRVRARRMFGGHGLYADDLFVALIAGERLYVKADADTEARFMAAGCAPFVYEGQGKAVKMSYWTVPDEAMESPSLMLPWARLAMQTALKAAAAKAGKPAATRRKAPPRAAPRAPRARPPRPRRCRPAAPSARRQRASGRRPGRQRVSA